MGTVLYFNMREANYKVRVAAIPDDGQPKLEVFRRGGMPWFSVGIIYDQTDEIIQSAENCSHPLTVNLEEKSQRQTGRLDTSVNRIEDSSRYILPRNRGTQ
jgi:hypothetical protein